MNLAGRSIWVRLVSLVNSMNRIEEKLLRADGEYEFESLKPGAYAVLFVEKVEILGVRTASVYVGQEVEVDPIQLPLTP